MNKPDGAISLDGLDAAIIGAAEHCDVEGRVLAYDENKIVEILIDEHDMTPNEAKDFLDFNIFQLRTGVGEPVFVSKLDGD